MSEAPTVEAAPRPSCVATPPAFMPPIAQADAMTPTTSAAPVPSTSSSPAVLPPDAAKRPNGQPIAPLPSNFSCGTSCSQIICTPLRTMVSQNRRRYQHDGFNLDLTYITDRIIAMGYPADTGEALYRNSMSHIVKFLEHYHPGHYKVFNLRGQYIYNPSKFHNRVVSFEMQDHHPPRLELMAPFCREVHEYLSADPKNVVAVHCKAGKGRTGVMICAYLCYINFYPSPRQNMDYYSIVRTHNNKGVTIPSQRRYVYYFNHLREKQLNYMPLKTELIGIYVEKPPKVCGTMTKGALKLRVANGDVDVFIGDDLWISKETFEEEEAAHRKHPAMVGEDHYDPSNPTGSGDCVSRRCYGWTVPRDKRVFLEGDVRVDLYHKTQMKIVKMAQERKKIGHIWFNTMFTCPGFCGGQYVHGDERYPYEDGASGIVKRRMRRKGTTDTSSSTDDLFRGGSSTSSFKSSSGCSDANGPDSAALDATITPHAVLSASVPSSPPVLGPSPRTNGNGGRTHGSVSPLALHDTNSDAMLAAMAETVAKASSGQLDTADLQPAVSITPTGATVSTKEAKKNRLPLKLNGFRRNKSPLGRASDSDVSGGAKAGSSQDGGLSRFSSASIPLVGSKLRGGPRSSVDSAVSKATAGGDANGADGALVEEYEVEQPPGLERHCPTDTLQTLHPFEKHPPRQDIEEMLKDACRRNLISDLYNTRRLSVPKDGPLMPKSPVERPKAGGPVCIMREPREHVGIYGILEVDRANKNKELDMGFRIIIVTRCVDESRQFEMQLAQQFVKVTREKQLKKDQDKNAKLQTTRMKFDSFSTASSGGKLAAASTQTNPPGSSASDSEPEGMTGALVTTECNEQGTATHIIPEHTNPLADARKHDPHLGKYFFRQRVTSQSRHPSYHYHCPLQAPDPAVCARYACRPKRNPNGPVTSDTETLEGEEDNRYKVLAMPPDDSQTQCASMFGEAGFEPLEAVSEEDLRFSASGKVQRDQRTSSETSSSWASSSNVANDTETSEGSSSDLSTEPHGRLATITVPAYAQCERGNQVAYVKSEKELRPSAEAAAAIAKARAAGISASSRELMAQVSRGEIHPSDTNWVSSSTSSSCQSLTEDA
ncbi:hypothetical protein M3Y99_00720000 [Aphelenchoides fujianensis]|nr:hypothetical protein M3Y99_00720000 [Aphelenchoides fujianensis]